MTTTKIPENDANTPEYRALHSVYRKLKDLIDLNPGNVADGLYEHQLLPTEPEGNQDSSALRTSILSCVKCKTMNFYIVLGVLNTLGTDADAKLTDIHQKFVDEVDGYVKCGSAENIKETPDAVFLSFSRKQPIEAQPIARESTIKLCDYLEHQHCNPWMDVKDLANGDNLSIKIFKTLKKCKAIVPIVTRGYAQSLWCMRELYYAKFVKTVQIHPVVIEDDWKKEGVGEWLNGVLGEVKYTFVGMQDRSTRDSKLNEVASQIAKALGKNPTTKNGSSSPSRSMLRRSAKPTVADLDLFERNGTTIKIIATCAAKWERVAIRLYFDHHIIESIKKDKHYQSMECCTEVFAVWLGGLSGAREPRTWSTVVKILSEAELGALSEKLNSLLTD